MQSQNEDALCLSAGLGDHTLIVFHKQMSASSLNAHDVQPQSDHDGPFIRSNAAGTAAQLGKIKASVSSMRNTIMKTHSDWRFSAAGKL